MATIQDVAEAAGVSVSTVSYVLSGSRPISAATKARVQEAMEKLGYRPHPHARALASKQSHLLALLIPPTRRGLGETEIDFTSHVSREALRAGYHTLLLTDEYDDLSSLQEFIHTSLVDGLILMEVHTYDPRVQLLSTTKIPFVLIGRCETIGDTTPDKSAERFSSEPSLNWVDIDFEGTLHTALEYFLELGHRDVAFINQSRAVYENGYGPVVRSFEALERARRLYAFEKLEHYFCEATNEAGYEITRHIIQQEPEIHALIVMNDRALPGVYRALYEEKKRIPEDVSVLSMVSSERAAEMLYPPVTTLEFPAQVLASQAVQQLICQIEGKQGGPLHNTLRCPLIERGSTGRRADKDSC
ncbi:LacI family DNA-binding transcriptional regulator [Treponema sp. J25]|uniref:LacI family DNA-binding transcriptional regulator n=1 Tax=Treponema sp. J25 TaxID=2094121 RepID=UPI001046D896|nr:LacI family DNA-binding transcriptional regulator [Treponema sp. J25]TCW61433.1 LacI family transcriptional regulator [Treponema sp. J25]